MSRLRQYFANRYTSSEATNSEFENIIRYLNAAELGNQTVAELLEKLFDSNGDLIYGIDFRFNSDTGIEYLTDATSQNWTLLVPAADIRGIPGVNVGTIEAPLFSNRVDFTTVLGQTVFPYVAPSSSNGLFNVIVWINGLLQVESSYNYSSTTNQVTMLVAPAEGALVSISTIRTSPVSAYARIDRSSAANQAVFPFPLEETDEIVVYKNGVLQREGGGYDYIKSATTDTITMTTNQPEGTIITIMRISNSAINDVTGLMFESQYATDGLIRLDKINIPAGAIAQSKVADLPANLAAKANISVSATPPASPGIGDLWVNTNYAVPTLLFNDGARWLNASPNGMIPLPLSSNALQFIRLNSTATSLEYASFDTSGLVQTSQIGAANGVAALNSLGKLPFSTIPEYAANVPMNGFILGAITNRDYVVGHLYGAKHSFVGMVAKLTSGTATLQLLVGGVTVGSTLGANSTTTNLAISETVIDASASIKDVVIRVTGASTPVDLSFMIDDSITG